MLNNKDELYEEFKKNFPELTFEQLWSIVKLCKMVRLRCRSNIAFNNAFNIIFQGRAEFKEVRKERKDGTSYMGLSIIMNGKEFNMEGELNE